MHLGEFLPPLIACAAYAIAYAVRARTLAREGRPVPRRRVAVFYAGVLLLTVVQVGPLDSLADSVLAAHMVQHILIGEVASFLVVVGLTGPLLAPWLSLRISRPLRALGHPVVALVLWTLDLYAWHVPLLYQLAIRHDLVHALEHASLFWFGFLLWFSLLGPLPKPAWFGNWTKLGYVLGVRVAGAVLANILLWSQQVIYPIYRASDAREGLNPISDQNVAGGIMMVVQMVLTIVLFGWLFYRAAIQEEERQQLLELAEDRGIALSEARAARAADGGGASRLRERLLTEEPASVRTDATSRRGPRR
ncbi:MAG: cytochrome c oxidase assembly protein [Solirubrobacteraceae bacterium]